MAARRTVLFLIAFSSYLLSGWSAGSRHLSSHDIVSMRGLQAVAISAEGGATACIRNVGSPINAT